MLEVAVLYGCDLSQVFTPIILRLYQPHSLCEKGATKAAAKAALYVFLLTPLREGRPATEPTIVTMPSYFYSRPYARGDFSAAPQNPGFRSDFYSRPYARGDLKTGSRSGRSRPFLLTPLREGRHVTMMAKECVRYISTHAPARGATGSLLVPPACQPDFYSRPYARGDTISGGGAIPLPLFLLTPLREGRPLHLSALLHSHTISTRAPTRGATPPISAPCS